jgi:hypothetical protein
MCCRESNPVATQFTDSAVQVRLLGEAIMKSTIVTMVTNILKMTVFWDVARSLVELIDVSEVLATSINTAMSLECRVV